jgi:tetratricopeptide (TPR) repeat protein
MREGIALLALGTPNALDEAIGAFDRAIALRRAIVDGGRPDYAFGLATGLLNRGEALARKADAVSLEAAIAAFGEGIDLLSALPWPVDGEIRRRLAVGWQNRGLALHAMGGRHRDARESFERAMQLLDEPAADDIGAKPTMVAAISISFASLLVESPDSESLDRARAAATLALRNVDAAAAETDPVTAEMAIKARYVLCRALAAALPDTGHADESGSATLHLTTDAVDEGLALARRWEQKGVDRFRSLAADLLRFGSRVYAKYQPHFLDEFLAENLDPEQSSGAYTGSPEVRVARLEALWLSFSRRGPRP